MPFFEPDQPLSIAVNSPVGFASDQPGSLPLARFFTDIKSPDGFVSDGIQEPNYVFPFLTQPKVERVVFSLKQSLHELLLEVACIFSEPLMVRR